MSHLQMAAVATSHSVVVPFLFAVGFGLVVFWLMRLGKRIGSERATALGQVAAAQGLQFSAQGSLEFSGAPAHLFMPYAKRSTCRNFITGQIEKVAVQFFDCTEIRGGSTTLGDLITVAVFRFPEAALPDFHLAGKNVGDGMAPAALQHWAVQQHGLKTDIPLDFFPATSTANPTRNLASRYCLLGDDPAAVRTFFTPARVNLIESADMEFYPWIIHASGPWILLGFRGAHVAPDAYPAFIAQTRALAEGLITRRELSS
jgi:hypothetical protein